MTADDGIRTRDLRFTKPLLYQLSYVGTKGANIASCQGPGNRTCDGLTLMLVLMIEINSRSFQRARRSRPTIKGSWHYESLANFAERDAFRSVAKDGLEAFDWFSQWLETEPERLMMHRHDELRASSVCHLDRLLRRAMVPDPWVVSGDRHDREIDGPVLAKLGKTVRERGVPSEQDAPSVSLHEIAIVTAMGVALHSRAPVFHLKGSDRDVAFCLTGEVEHFRFAPAKLGDVSEKCPSQQVCSVRSSDYAGLFIKAVERSQIEMIEVGMG